MTGKEISYIRESHNIGHLSGNGPFTKKCHDWLEKTITCRKALLTHSCTAALEMAAILGNIQPGDEIIMPSYTFVSTANAFVLRGGVPLFVDIRSDTLNIDEEKIESAITKRTKAIVPVHYAGVACEMNKIMAIAKKHNLLVIEDAAQSMSSRYDEKPLGSIGHLAAISFHETKNIISGEGGALLVNDQRFVDRAEVIWEKGTNRNKFFQGLVDKYTWVDIGSSFLPSELTAAFLWAQMEEADDITNRRMSIWKEYHELLAGMEKSGFLHRPQSVTRCKHNAHMYYILLSDHVARNMLLKYLQESGIGAIFHYVPLHSSPAGEKYGRSCDELRCTNDISERIIRLPLWLGMTFTDIQYICNKIRSFFEDHR